MTIQPDRITSYSLGRSSRGDDIRRVLVAAINGINAGQAIKTHVIYNANHLVIDKSEYDLSKYRRIFIIGVGKACIPMAYSISELLLDRIYTGLLITKDGYLNSEKYPIPPQVNVIEANHPIPDHRNLDAALKVITLTKKITRDDLVICLLSGGGSSLLMYPYHEITLQDIQASTSLLLSCGASITELNTFRKHVDRFKGGGLLKFLSHATVISLILSDVMGNYPEVIASGPTFADPTTYNDVWTIFNKYQLMDQLPTRIKSFVSAGIRGEIQETIKPGDLILNNISNIIVGSSADAVVSAIDTAKEYGFNITELPFHLIGEASEMGKVLAEEAKSLFSRSSSGIHPTCLIAGGETTVTLKGNGKGGRNQELALGAVKYLAGDKKITLVSLATDGGDGPTDAAGAVATNETYSRGIAMGMDPDEYLKSNDSYHYFEPLGDLIRTGPTMTNVNDLVFIFNL
jgi:glycerate 2-kinase